jgi:hypothetical protein
VSTNSLPDGSPAGASANVPGPLRVAALLLAVEGALAAVLGVIEAFAIHGDRLVLGVTTTAFLILYGAGLVLVARGLSRAAPWSRGPAVFAQLIQLGVAWSFWGGSTSWVAVLLAASALAALIAIFRRSSMAALVDDPNRP